MQLVLLLQSLLLAALVGCAIAVSSNSTAAVKEISSVNQSVSTESSTSTNCTERGGGSCCGYGADEVLESIWDLAESVKKLASAVESSNLFKGPVPRYLQSYFHHCSHAYAMGWHDSGVYLVKPDQNEPFEVYCDMETAGGGWTVVQRRVDGSVDFNRPWEDYVKGFGNITDGRSGEFWLGLEKIHRLTSSSTISQLHIDLTDFEGRTAFAHYSAFAVGTSDTEYKLVLSGYNASSTAGNALSQMSSVSFSTSDNDNDISLSHVNCAAVNKAGWWFKDSACGLSNLNGRYLAGMHYNSAKEGIYWHYFGGTSYSLKRAEMKIRGVD